MAEKKDFKGDKNIVATKGRFKIIKDIPPNYANVALKKEDNKIKGMSWVDKTAKSYAEIQTKKPLVGRCQATLF